MKKFLIGAIGVLALASCSQNETLEVNNDGNEILFGVSTENATRAAELFTSTNLPNDFVVYASYTGSTSNKFMDAVNVQKGTSVWETVGKTYYWPTGSNVNPIYFTAVKNAGDDVAFTAQDASNLVKSTGFTVKDNVNEQVDFIYATAKATKSASPVELNFKHALSQVVFKAKNNSKTIDVAIDAVQVCYLDSKGDFSITNTTATSTLWDNRSEKKQYEVTFTKVDLPHITGEATEGEVKNLTFADVKEKNNSTALLMIPQKVSACTTTNAKEVMDDNADGFYFLVKCRFYDSSNGTYLWTNPVDEEGIDYQTKYVAIPAAIDWTAGMRYVYTFVFGDDMNGGYVPGTEDPVLFPITFSVAVADFADVEKDVNLETQPEP
ncbi:MAG: fimbrillin family protein [Lepagella sp.]